MQRTSSSVSKSQSSAISARVSRYVAACSHVTHLTTAYLQTRLEAAVTERMTQDQHIKHYKVKADAEREKLKVAEDAASDVQKEYEVGTSTIIHTALPDLSPSSGLRRLLTTVNVSPTLARPT